MESKSFLREFAAQAPELPGVYQFYSQRQEILYIGKAKNLRNRLKSYSQLSPDLKTQILVEKIDNCTLTVTDTEEDALVLEQKLIRQHKPPYNILLKDDKSYPYIILSRHSFPQIKTFRGVLSSDDLKYAFGPYPSVDVAKKTLEILIDVFQLRTCSDHTFISRTRPCLQYQIQRCSAPCVGYVTQEQYRESVHKVRDFLKRSSSYVIDFLVDKMNSYSETEQFEKAALLCAHIKQLRSLQRRTSEVDLRSQRIDILVFQWPYAHHIMVTGGDVISSAFHVIKTEGHYEQDLALCAMLNYLYSPLDKSWIPDFIITDNAGQSSLDIMGKAVTITSAETNLEHRWLEMAQQSLWQNIHQLKNKSQFFRTRFESLEKVLGLESIESIDCLDISHMGGEHTVGGVVRMTPEGFDKSCYRRYNIKKDTAVINDDYFSIYQATFRHLSKQSEKNNLPSLLLIDGGKGQLTSAIRARFELALDLPILAIAKGDHRKFGQETLYKFNTQTDTFEQVKLNKLDKAFHLLGQVRDEAHRYSITTVRKNTSKKTHSSPLDSVNGIGAKKKKDLLSFFGGWQGLKQASYEQLVQVKGIGPKMAKELFEFLKKNS